MALIKKEKSHLLICRFKFTKLRLTAASSLFLSRCHLFSQYHLSCQVGFWLYTSKTPIHVCLSDIRQASSCLVARKEWQIKHLEIKIDRIAEFQFGSHKIMSSTRPLPTDLRSHVQVSVYNMRTSEACETCEADMEADVPHWLADCASPVLVRSYCCTSWTSRMNHMQIDHTMLYYKKLFKIVQIQIIFREAWT